MLFDISKLLWSLIDPVSLLMPLIALATILLWTRWLRLARLGLSLILASLLIVSILPLGGWMVWLLENRFPVMHQPPLQVDGIIVLGGSFDQLITKQRDQVAISGSAERLTEFARLSLLFPKAELVFSGGSSKSGDLPSESTIAKRLLTDLGLDTTRITFEDKSRNTFQNATFSKAMMPVSQGQTWLLVTSAFHMPRAMGSFRKTGWPVHAYPVDFKTTLEAPMPGWTNTISAVSVLSFALHEWLGLLSYYYMNRTSDFFAGPLPPGQTISVK